MSSQPDPIDSQIARALEPLRSATPPEGMEARISQRLAAQPAAPSRLGALLESAWLRGALTGTLLATAACALAFYIARTPGAPPKLGWGGNGAASASTMPHSSRSHRDEWDGGLTSANPPTHVALNSSAQANRVPCVTQLPRTASAWLGNITTPFRVPHSSRPYRGQWDERGRSPHLIPASFAPSKPAPPAPLTPQERALIQLARTATPAELAALNPSSIGVQSEAEREAAFKKFFAPSPDILAIDKAQGVPADPSSANPSPQTEVQNE